VRRCDVAAQGAQVGIYRTVGANEAHPHAAQLKSDTKRRPEQGEAAMRPHPFIIFATSAGTDTRTLRPPRLPKRLLRSSPPNQARCRLVPRDILPCEPRCRPAGAVLANYRVSSGGWSLEPIHSYDIGESERKSAKRKLDMVSDESDKIGLSNPV
jgi:hypothetical protein